MAKKNKIITTSSKWNIEILEKYYKEIARIGKDYLKLDTYPNQIEIVTSEQMLDAYSTVGLPLSYNHWKFGKDFSMNEANYKKGRMGLSYEMIINSDPCISYNMEENSSCMMALVLAHACMGHNAFFKSNYMFKQWTHADAIVDYMVFAKKYVADCEERYGYEEVEEVLDACHALMDYGVDKYKHPSPISMEEEAQRMKEWAENEKAIFDDIWRTLPEKDEEYKVKKKKRYPAEPQENILYFLEKNSQHLETWKRELIRIVRKVAQYFYPQGQTKIINEGFATFTHYEIVNKLHEEGFVDDGFMLEFFHHHSSVIFQPDFRSKFYSGFNPYTLGFNIFMDIKRICENPTDEDKEWFPNLAGKNWLEEIHYAMENFRDDSFILQYLSPKVMRDMKMFLVLDEHERDHWEIEKIHNRRGYERIRKYLSEYYSRANYIPDVQVYNVDVKGDRTLTLRHYKRNGRTLNANDAEEVLYHLNYLWGFPVELESIDEDGDIEIISEFY